MYRYIDIYRYRYRYVCIYLIFVNKRRYINGINKLKYGNMGHNNNITMKNI